MDSNSLRDIILNCTTPVLLQNITIPWLNDFNVSEWCKVIDNVQPNGVEFDSCPLLNSDRPQWERLRTKQRMTFSDFYNQSINDRLDNHRWLSYSYKSIRDLPESSGKRSIDFSFCGFPNGSTDILFWLGSKGSNTPCHYDTYGCNVVVQVAGEKTWTLFPPEAKLRMVRVPYEESSVYCAENFYSPSDVVHRFSEIATLAHHVSLKAGDVLVVPPKWWHYVETVSPTALAFNTWIPLDTDADNQMNEAIVRIIIDKFTSSLSEADMSIILNPNEVNEFKNTIETINLLEILDYFRKEHNQKLIAAADSEPPSKRATQTLPFKRGYLSTSELDNLLLKHKANVQTIEKLTENEFNQIILQNSKRFDSTIENPKYSNTVNVLIDLINSFCHPNIIESVKKLFLNNS